MDNDEISEVISDHVTHLVAQVQHLVLAKKLTKDAATQTNWSKPIELRPAHTADNAEKSASRQRLIMKMRKEAHIHVEPPAKVFSPEDKSRGNQAARQAVREYSAIHHTKNLEQQLARKKNQADKLLAAAIKEEEKERQQDAQLYEELRNEYKQQLRLQYLDEQRKEKIKAMMQELHKEDDRLRAEVETELVEQQNASRRKFAKAKQQADDIERQLQKHNKSLGAKAPELYQPAIQPAREAGGQGQAANQRHRQQSHTQEKEDESDCTHSDSDQAITATSKCPQAEKSDTDGREAQKKLTTSDPRPSDQAGQLRRPMTSRASSTHSFAERQRDSSQLHPFHAHFEAKEKSYKERARRYRTDAASLRQQHIQKQLEKDID